MGSRLSCCLCLARKASIAGHGGIKVFPVPCWEEVLGYMGGHEDLGDVRSPLRRKKGVKPAHQGQAMGPPMTKVPAGCVARAV